MQEHLKLLEQLQIDSQADNQKQKQEEQYGGQYGEQHFLRQWEALQEREADSAIFLPAKYLRERCALADIQYWLMILAFGCETGGGPSQCSCLQQAIQLLSGVFPIEYAFIADFCRKDGILHSILELSGEGKDNQGQMPGRVLTQPLRLTPLAFCFLLTGRLRQESWYDIFLAGEQALPETELLPLHEKEYNRLLACCSREEPARILLHGSRGSGKHTLMRRVCEAVSVNGLFLKPEMLSPEEGNNGTQIMESIRLLICLLEPVVIWELPGEENTSLDINRMLKTVDDYLSNYYNGSKIIHMTQNETGARQAEAYADMGILLSGTLSSDDKRRALDAWLSPAERQIWQEELLNRYHLNIGEWKRKQKAIELHTCMEPSASTDREAWIAALQDMDTTSPVGRIVEYRYGKEELILPEDCRRQLDTVIELAQGWTGVGGLHLLFHGSSGTGKTMAASIIAHKLGLRLFKVDLSQVFDKYIGETEKHMDEIFRRAQRGQYILFFDEADALFSKRTNIGDSHDKYANVSTSYLLQRIEEYEGMLILATNLMNHFDDAFVRRIRFVIRFQNLNQQDRARMWEKALEGDMPVSEDISWEALARAAELSPARIRGAAQTAQMLARCRGSTTIAEEHVRRALELEAAKDETTVKWGQTYAKKLCDTNERIERRP